MRSGFMIGRTLRLPVVVEVEPVIRSAPHVHLEPLRITLRESRDGGFAIVPRKLQTIGEEFQVRCVAVAAVVNAESENDRDTERVGHLPRTHRKMSAAAQKIDRDGSIGLESAV